MRAVHSDGVNGRRGRVATRMAQGSARADVAVGARRRARTGARRPPCAARPPVAAATSPPAMASTIGACRSRAIIVGACGRLAVHDRDPDAPFEVAPGLHQHRVARQLAQQQVEAEVGLQVLREVVRRVGELGQRGAQRRRPRSSCCGEAMISATARPSSAARTRNSSRTSCGDTVFTRSIPRLPAVTSPSCWRWRNASRTVPRLTPEVARQLDLAEVVAGPVAARDDRRPQRLQRPLPQRAAVQAGQRLRAHPAQDTRQMSTVAYWLSTRRVVTPARRRCGCRPGRAA